jgi:hypothetical protein
MSGDYSLSSEISHKCLNTLERLHNDGSKKNVSASAYNYASQLLWDAFSGLVPSDLNDMLAELPPAPADGSETLKRVFRKETTVAILKKSFTGLVTIEIRDLLDNSEHFKTFDFFEEDVPNLSASDFFERKIEQFKKSNFTEM